MRLQETVGLQVRALRARREFALLQPGTRPMGVLVQDGGRLLLALALLPPRLVVPGGEFRGGGGRERPSDFRDDP